MSTLFKVWLAFSETVQLKDKCDRAKVDTSHAGPSWFKRK